MARDPIRFIDAETGSVREERVYGGAWIQFLYGTRIGRMLTWIVAAPPVSKVYGWLQDTPWSRKKVKPFIERFDIRMSDFVPEDGRPDDDPYSTFNRFFTRRVAAHARPFVQGSEFPAPCDARYFGYQSLNDEVRVPVKGMYFQAHALLANERWHALFENGPGFIARLCPVDYHRFHFADDGQVLDSWRIAGALHSVNPWALACRDDIFMINERQVTVLETEHFGKLAYVEVGATCVGKIVQTYSGPSFRRGDEKGMFLFGGSTVIVLGEPGRWRVRPDIAESTSLGMETYLKMGAAIGRANKSLTSCP